MDAVSGCLRAQESAGGRPEAGDAGAVGNQESVGADGGAVGMGLSSIAQTAAFTRAWLAAPAFGSARPKMVVVKIETVRRPVPSV